MTSIHPGRSPALFFVALFVLAFVGTWVLSPAVGRDQAVAVTGPVLGVLEADPQWISPDGGAGVRVAVVNASWRLWEPSAGRFDPAYRSQITTIAASYRSVGWTVSVDPGLQDPPAWALQQQGGRLVDQRGARSATADFEFSQAVRTAAAAYLGNLVASVGSDVSGFRVGLSGDGEVLYPNTTTNQWWAYGASAQRGGSDLPAGVGVTPLRGWVPGAVGSPSPSGTQIRAWYDWYFAAMLDAHAWEIATYRRSGFGGQLDLVMPGTGAIPSVYEARLDAHLASIPTDPSFTMNTGAVWWRFLDGLPDQRGLRVDVSSVYDPSGRPRGNGCQVGDDRVEYRSSTEIANWSDTRWLSYLARRHHLPVVGENPGNTPPSAVRLVVALARQCGLGLLQWAWDYQLHGVGATQSRPLASLGQVGRAVSRPG